MLKGNGDQKKCTVLLFVWGFFNMEHTLAIDLIFLKLLLLKYVAMKTTIKSILDEVQNINQWSIFLSMNIP